ncbi:MAG TPA: TrkA family potassium uptake protein [Clostridiales bacterium]|nr:TrkA family potassium uptake protein [Clostridiales bacterium]
MNHKTKYEFGVIGLGRFGYSLATSLAEAKREVLVLDSSENKIRQIRHWTDNAFVVNDLTKEALMEAGIQHCRNVIVCIGEKVDASILTTLNVIGMGVDRVIAKAISPEHGKILEKIGAEVIFPERDMALRLANRLLASRVMDYISLNNDITITELKLTSKLEGQTVIQASLRKKFNLNIIALQRKDTTTTEITPEMVLNENDIVVIIGKKDHIKKFENFLVK